MSQPEMQGRRPALPVIVRALKALSRLDGGELKWALEAHSNGVVVRLDGPGTARVLVTAAAAERAWARTPSLALTLKSSEDGDQSGPAEGGGSPHAEHLKMLLQLLRRLDPGDLVLEPTVVRQQGAAGSTPAVPLDEGEVARIAEARDARVALAERTRIALADELHWASFVAYNAILGEDLYPHVGQLGRPVTRDEIMDGWQRTLAARSRGEGAQKLGLYAHIPFCATVCTFCYCARTDDFDRRGFEDYLTYLLAEAEGFGPLFQGQTFTSVYFGGGTPSLLPAPYMRRMFDVLWRNFDVPRGTQVIFEGNPDSLSDAKIAVLAGQGRVNRLTIGVQTLDDDVQRTVRRFNKPSQVRDAIDSARRHGIRHVNVDIMAGLPGQTLESFLFDVERLLAMEPDSIHLNGYRPLPRTRLAMGGHDETQSAVWRERRDEMLRQARAILKERGHATKGDGRMRRTQDASNMQEYDLRRQNSSLLGLGFSALSHSFGSLFYTNDRSEDYEASLRRDVGGDRRWRGIDATGQEEHHKYMVTNLRTGWDNAEFRALFGCEPTDLAPKALQKLADLDVLDITDDRVVTRTGVHADTMTYRVLLYSEAFMDVVRRGWGPKYDRSADYPGLLRKMLEAPGSGS
jgi:oxygen-independent coproporphyrinogen III oxidase